MDNYKKRVGQKIYNLLYTLLFVPLILYINVNIHGVILFFTSLFTHCYLLHSNDTQLSDTLEKYSIKPGFNSLTCIYFLFIGMVSIATCIIKEHSVYFYYYYFILWALLVSLLTDAYEYVIARNVTLFLMPIVYIFALLHTAPLSITESLIGTLFGFLLMYSIKKISLYFLHKEGLGQGDVELMTFIGSALGPIAVWASLTIGSIVTLLVAFPYLFITKKNGLIIPFGVSLVSGLFLFLKFKLFFTSFLTMIF